MRAQTTPLGIIIGPYGGIGYVGEPLDPSWIKVLLRWLGLKLD